MGGDVALESISPISSIAPPSNSARSEMVVLSLLDNLSSLGAVCSDVIAGGGRVWERDWVVGGTGCTSTGAAAGGDGFVAL